MSFTLPEGGFGADADHADFAKSLSGRVPDALIAKRLDDHMRSGEIPFPCRRKAANSAGAGHTPLRDNTLTK